MASEPGSGAASGDIRSTVLAELAAGPKDDAPAAEAPAEEVETASQDEAVEEVEVAAEAEAEVEATEDDDEAADDDPKAAKGLDRVRRAETRMREQFDAREQMFVSEWKPRVEAAERFEARIKDTVKNPYLIADLLLEHGMSEDDFEAAAQTLVANSAKYKNDPKYRESVTRSKKEREMYERLTATEKKLADREAAEKAQAERAEQVARGQKLLDGYVKAVKADKAPLLAAALAKNAPRAHTRLAQIAAEIFDTTGNTPAAAAVHAEYEKQRRAELEELGIDVATVIKTPGKAPVVETKKGAPAKAPANMNGTAKKAPTRDEIVAELKTLS